MLEIKNTNLEMKNAFNGVINRLGMAKEGIIELEEMSVEISKTELQREKKNKNDRYPRIVGQLQKV